MKNKALILATFILLMGSALTGSATTPLETIVHARGILSEDTLNNDFRSYGNTHYDISTNLTLSGNLTSPAPNIIVIGWDGVQRDHFRECVNEELPECAGGLPNLQELAGGKFFYNTTTSGATVTKPGWAQILSGYNAEVMGIYNNNNFQPLPEGYSVFEKIENHFGPDNVVTMFIAGKGKHVDGDCSKGEPWCITKTHLDYYEIFLGANENVGNLALELLENHKNDMFFAFFHFREPDYTGHIRGENSEEYSLGIIDEDLWLGTIVKKLKQLGIYDQTYIYVVTDHGFDEGLIFHNNAPYGFLASNDPMITRSGDRKDLAPTILQRYGISLEANGDIPAVDGYPLTSIPPIACIPEGEAFLDYPWAPVCCENLDIIGFERVIYVNQYCWRPTGGRGDRSGYCTSCGNGFCESPENQCNCPVDCKIDTATTIMSVKPDPSLIYQPIEVKFDVVATDSDSDIYIPNTVEGKVVVTVEGSIESCNTKLSNGEGSCTITLENLGLYNLTATYTGNAVFNPSSNTVQHRVDHSKVFIPLLLDIQ